MGNNAISIKEMKDLEFYQIQINVNMLREILHMSRTNNYCIYQFNQIKQFENKFNSIFDPEWLIYATKKYSALQKGKSCV